MYPQAKNTFTAPALSFIVSPCFKCNVWPLFCPSLRRLSGTFGKMAQLLICKGLVIMCLMKIMNVKKGRSAKILDQKAAYMVMSSTGGWLLVFQSVLPSVGIGALSSREAEGRANTSSREKKVHKLLLPADKTLKTMAMELAEYQKWTSPPPYSLHRDC